MSASVCVRVSEPGRASIIIPSPSPPKHTHRRKERGKRTELGRHLLRQVLHDEHARGAAVGEAAHLEEGQAERAHGLGGGAEDAVQVLAGEGGRRVGGGRGRGFARRGLAVAAVAVGVGVGGWRWWV